MTFLRNWNNSSIYLSIYLFIYLSIFLIGLIEAIYSTCIVVFYLNTLTWFSWCTIVQCTLQVRGSFWTKSRRCSRPATRPCTFVINSSLSLTLRIFLQLKWPVFSFFYLNMYLSIYIPIYIFIFLSIYHNFWALHEIPFWIEPLISAEKVITF